MQSFDTKGDPAERSPTTRQTIVIGRLEDLPSGSCKTVDLPEGRELALYNINGEFYASENFCPQRRTISGRGWGAVRSGNRMRLARLAI